MTEYVFCEKCGNKNVTKDIFCIQCGNKLHKPISNIEVSQSSLPNNMNTFSYSNSSSKTFDYIVKPKLTDEQIQTFSTYADHWQSLARFADSNYIKQYPYGHTQNTNTQTAFSSTNNNSAQKNNLHNSQIDKNTLTISILATVLIILIGILILVICM